MNHLHLSLGGHLGAYGVDVDWYPVLLDLLERVGLVGWVVGHTLMLFNINGILGPANPLYRPRSIMCSTRWEAKAYLQRAIK